MPRRISLALLVVACASAGCLRSVTTIDLRPDGSGTILQETAMTADALEMMKSVGDPTGKTPTEFFTEEAARKAAATMGVKFVSTEPYQTADLKGSRVRFAFDDITKVHVNLDSSGSPLSESEKKDPLFSFSFDRRPASSLLTIQMPQDKPGGFELLAGGRGAIASSDTTESAEAMAMAKMMTKGMFIDVSLNVNGRILKSNAPYIEGSRVTLMLIDFDKVLADEAALRTLLGASDAKSLQGVPGLKLVNEPTVSIEFSR